VSFLSSFPVVFLAHYPNYVLISIRDAMHIRFDVKNPEMGDLNCNWSWIRQRPLNLHVMVMAFVIYECIVTACACAPVP
jgi:hypothetical protein